MSWSFWLIFGLALLVFEILTPGGFFTVFFGLAAFVVAALVWGTSLLDSGASQWLTFGVLGTALGSLAGLSLGGSTVLGAMAASASYIAAPPAARMTLPTANPTYYLTSSLAITFPFNVTIGIPIYYQLARLLHGGA